ncbi:MULTISPECIES: glycine--tRNA ligase subunit beta [Roseomonadaceae]|uniref:Glycine--tRNA ligase beta subunit n=1 Tax=Falsiroseomonas oleicola TaxID=2801474 RepID=A0ABS6H2X6_9PROT|nr:glycine--tRNA ligase subunit beta [Roseomonas oleicola]MBU8543001.1 glycine--tRNA ligase subunit beta [Roseomonas oleicola]
MPEFLLELFSEEIPARMQARGAEDLARVFATAAAPLLEGAPKPFYGPRRIGLSATLRAEVTTEGKEERGPRTAAPPAALEGFLRKHGATREQLVDQNGFWVLQKPGETIAAAALLSQVLPGLIQNFGWPKSMRWNGPFTWVRPLHRILCLLDGQVVPFAIEALPGMESGNLTEGHRIMAAEDRVFAVTGLADYEAGLRARFVEPDAAARMALIETGLAKLAAEQGVAVVPDRGLLEEVAGLVEWPVPLLGRIDDAFMDLPAELMRTTMRVNQRYFSMTKPEGGAAPFFGLVANIVPNDGGTALIAGNERVLRARLSDARFFWDQDRKQKLEDFLPKLDDMVFQAKLGTQRQRVERLERLARWLAPKVRANADDAALAAKLAKADLASGLVGEFPELQGTIGRYYALNQGEKPAVAQAIGTQYRPLGPGDAVPSEPVAIALSLADKLDTLVGFFAIAEKPTGSGDPYALRRAALGMLRLLREGNVRLPLRPSIEFAYDCFMDTWIGGFHLAQDISVERQAAGDPLDFERMMEEDDLQRAKNDQANVYVVGTGVVADFMEGDDGQIYRTSHVTRAASKERAVRLVPKSALVGELLDFLAERLRVQLRAEGARHDLVAAAFGQGGEDDLLRLLARAEALKTLVEGPDGPNLLAAAKRAANILRIEDKKDGPHAGPVDPALLTAPEEQALAAALDSAEPAVAQALLAEDFATAMSALAALRAPLDAFFEKVIVNDPDKATRANRLRLLARLRGAMDTVADFSRIEG